MLFVWGVSSLFLDSGLQTALPDFLKHLGVFHPSHFHMTTIHGDAVLNDSKTLEADGSCWLQPPAIIVTDCV